MPTRVTGDTATLVDNIFSNDVDCLDMMNGIFYNDISDHFPILSVNFKGHIADTKQYITKRMLTTNCFPVKTFSVEQKYRNRKPWLTEGMKN